jgi:hypothetical protein
VARGPRWASCFSRAGRPLLNALAGAPLDSCRCRFGSRLDAFVGSLHTFAEAVAGAAVRPVPPWRCRARSWDLEAPPACRAPVRIRFRSPRRTAPDAPDVMRPVRLRVSCRSWLSRGFPSQLLLEGHTRSRRTSGSDHSHGRLLPRTVGTHHFEHNGSAGTSHHVCLPRYRSDTASNRLGHARGDTALKLTRAPSGLASQPLHRSASSCASEGAKSRSETIVAACT